MSSECMVVAPINARHLQSVTLFGAVGNCLSSPQFMMAKATNIESFKLFLVQLAGARVNPYSERKPVLVMDNHPAHRSSKCTELLNQYFRPEFQPAYSSPFNPVETCWALLKREYFVRLHRRETNFRTMEEFRSMLKEVVEDVPLVQANLLRVNRPYVEFHARIRPPD